MESPYDLQRLPVEKVLEGRGSLARDAYALLVIDPPGLPQRRGWAVSAADLLRRVGLMPLARLLLGKLMTLPIRTDDGSVRPRMEEKHD